MIKIIKIESCGDCDYSYHFVTSESQLKCEKLNDKSVEIEKIDPSCPLENYQDIKEYRNIIAGMLMAQDGIVDFYDRNLRRLVDEHKEADKFMYPEKYKEKDK